MKHPIRRLAVGAALAGAAFAATPALASASSTCSFDLKSHYVYIQDGSGSDALTVSRGDHGAITFADGLKPAAKCFDQHTPAAVGNTDTIYIQGPAVGKYDTIEYDESNGQFAPGATSEATGTPEIELYSMSTSNELYAVDVVGTTGADTIHVGDKGSIDLDADGDMDVEETFGASAVILHGGDGGDTLDGRGWGQVGPTTVPETFYGGDGNDFLAPGRQYNIVYGEKGNDQMVLNANGYPDTFSGGEDYDSASLDTFDSGDAEAKLFPGH
jgi:hypothetical protein